MFSVFVGKYQRPSETKKDERKLTDIGINSYLFHLGAFYTLKVGTYSTEDKALKTTKLLQMYNFHDVFMQ